MVLGRTKSGWLTVTKTADPEVRKTAREDHGLDAVYRAVQFDPQSAAQAERRSTARTLAAPALKHKNPTEVGRPAPSYHSKLARRREATVRHPVDDREVGDIFCFTNRRFFRFQHRNVHHDELFDDDNANHRTLNPPALHHADRGRDYGSPRIGSRSYRSLTDRPVSRATLLQNQAAAVVVRKPKPPPLSRPTSLALAVRGWHAVERGTLPGGPSVARRKFEYLPAWEKTSAAQFSRDQAKLMLEDGLAGRPSPLGLVNSARPSATGSQQRVKHPLHVGEAAPTELDRNMPCASKLGTGPGATAKVVPSDVDMSVIQALSRDKQSGMPHHRLNDKGTGLRSHHKLKRGLNSSPWSLTMAEIAHSHRLWVAAAVTLQGNFRIQKAKKKMKLRNNSATKIQKRMRGILARKVAATRHRAVNMIQRVERGRAIRSRTAKDRQAKRLARLARQRQEQIDKLMFSAKAVTTAKHHIMEGQHAREEAKDQESLEQFRLEHISLEEDLRQQQEALAAEAARLEQERLKKTLMCFGRDDPFSSDPAEVKRFANDARTGRVIRCTDGITRVVYSIEEARKVINTNFNARVSINPASLRGQGL